MRGLSVCVTSVILFAAVGCDSKSDAQAVAQGGMASGRVVGVDGKPVSVAGVKVSLAIDGISEAGEKVVYTPTVKPDGTWSTRLVSGTYHATRASITVPFEGNAFEYPLVPAKEVGDFESKDGLAVDFVWHITGPTPTAGMTPDVENAFNFFGRRSA